MGYPTSRKAYTDCYTILDRASASSKGIRLSVSSHGDAINLRARIHYARKLDRDANREIYREQIDHPLYGCSIYDPLRVRLAQDTENGWWLYIEPIDATQHHIEDLDDGPDAQAED